MRKAKQDLRASDSSHPPFFRPSRSRPRSCRCSSGGRSVNRPRWTSRQFHSSADRPQCNVSSPSTQAAKGEVAHPALIDFGWRTSAVCQSRPAAEVAASVTTANTSLPAHRSRTLAPGCRETLHHINLRSHHTKIQSSNCTPFQSLADAQYPVMACRCCRNCGDDVRP